MIGLRFTHSHPKYAGTLGIGECVVSVGHCWSACWLAGLLAGLLVCLRLACVKSVFIFIKPIVNF
jgi:hypothetical protein